MFNTPFGFARQINVCVNGQNRRCSSLSGNANFLSSAVFVDQRCADSIMARSSAPQTGRIHLRRPTTHDNDSACNPAADHTISMACFCPVTWMHELHHLIQCAAPATNAYRDRLSMSSIKRDVKKKV